MQVLYVGYTYSFNKKEVLEYAVLPDDGNTPTDVVVLSRAPTECTKYYPDYERGLTKVFDWETVSCLYVVSGQMVQALGTNIFRLHRVSVVDRIKVADLVEATVKKAEEVRAQLESGSVEDVTYTVPTEKGGKFPAELVLFKSPENEEALISVLRMMAKKVTASRRRVLLVSPVAFKINGEWVAVPITRALHIIREDPTAVKAAGILDPDGFAVPFMIHDEVPPEALGSSQDHYTNVEFINNIVREAVMSTLITFTPGAGNESGWM